MCPEHLPQLHLPHLHLPHLHLPQLHLPHLHLPQLHLLAGFATGAQMELVQPLSVREEHRVVIGATPTGTSVRLAVVESGVLPDLPQPHQQRLLQARQPAAEPAVVEMWVTAFVLIPLSVAPSGVGAVTQRITVIN
jgi:hypothetical protein